MQLGPIWPIQLGLRVAQSPPRMKIKIGPTLSVDTLFPTLQVEKGIDTFISQKITTKYNSKLKHRIKDLCKEHRFLAKKIS